MSNQFEWFDAARFGMFIHWGVYTMGATAVWQKSFERLTDEQYDRYVKHFNPDRFNPEEWARLARRAGMKYFVFTSKHHDGYCLFDSQYTEYKYHHQDLLCKVIDAFRSEGLRVGVYYSLPDWHHPNYPRDARHPQHADPQLSDFNPYTEYLHHQVRELLSHYGKIDLLWFDGSYPDTEHIWNTPKLNDMIHSLQPEILVSRLPGYSDFDTPEQTIPRQGLFDDNGMPVRWEGCQVLHGEWGYIRDKKWKTSAELVQMLVRHASRGGNLLLNVGPTSRGALDEHTVELLEELGKWMDWNGRSIYNCSGAPAEFPEPEGCRYTWNAEKKTLYVHFLTWPDHRIDLPNLAGKVEYAQLLADGGEIRFREYLPGNVHGPEDPAPGTLRLALPIESPKNCPVPVIELFLQN
ncbi:MAG: Alpha-L-fucosidase [Lentisphaerae bacterium ADurb.Bin242]|nr:MAG: Alpha-L-fucosidase [Lentisphaerae bacterium ADurb.Bin242]